MKYQYAVVETLNGNYRLKSLEKAEASLDSIEMELYGDTMEDIKAQYKEHVKELKQYA